MCEVQKESKLEVYVPKWVREHFTAKIQGILAHNYPALLGKWAFSSADTQSTLH